MTKKELIEALEEYPDDAELNFLYGWSDINIIDITLV